MIVHAVASGRDGGMEAQNIIGHAGQETCGPFSTPTELPDLDAQFGQSNGDVGFHHARIHFLLGDGVATNGQAIARAQNRLVRLGRRNQAKALKKGIVWQSHERLCRRGQNEQQRQKDGGVADFHAYVLRTCVGFVNGFHRLQTAGFQKSLERPMRLQNFVVR